MHVCIGACECMCAVRVCRLLNCVTWVSVVLTLNFATTALAARKFWPQWNNLMLQLSDEALG